MDDLAEYQAEGSELLDVGGNPFATLATVNRKIVSLDSLPEHLPRAFVAVEDHRFYDHGGMDFRRLAGAMVANVRAGGVAEGGSTITQQLARNLFPEWLPYTERSLRRKVMEARVARQIEREFSKDKILELYLNHIYLGSGAYGVEAASRTYFGKPAAELSLEEAATLAALPKAPSNLNPRDNPEGALERRNLVLNEMVEAGFVDRATANAAQQRPIELARGGKDEGLKSSWFVERVRQEMQEIVGARFYTAGLRIHTTLDPTAQLAAEEELERQLRAVERGGFGPYRHASYDPSDDSPAEGGQTRYLQGVVIVMDAASGEVRALVGGRDFDQSKFDRAVQARRQPGSAFKPFVYLTALERYRSPVHQVEDAPLRLVSSGGRAWEPRNYSGRYDGQMTLREALVRSKNTPTVRIAQDLGMGSVIRTAQRLGVESEIPDYPSSALGAAEVRPIELTRAYAAFGNGGYRVEPHLIRRVENRYGQTVWEASPRRDRVVDPAAAFVLTSILRDVVDRGTGTGVRAAGFRGAAAGKTGTTNGATDVWFVGYTPELVGTVWIGMDDPKTIVRGATGGRLAAPVWGRVMRRIYAGRSAPSGWAAPSGVVQAAVERGSGRVVSADCPARGPTYDEYFLGSPPRAVCDVYSTYALDGDTAWSDEEWMTGMDYELDLDGDPDTRGVRDSLAAAGIDWPELERLRDRVQVGDSAGSAGRGRPATRPLPGGQPPTPGREAPGERRAEPPAGQAADPPSEPQPLGEPAREPEPTPPPAPADTSSAAGAS